MAAPPGADRHFVEDPTKAGLSDVVADQSAILQTALDLLAGLVVGDANQALVEQLQARATTARVATENLTTKEVNQRMPPPLTRVPQAEWGDNDLQNVKYSHIAKFSGEVFDNNLVYIWLNSVVDVAEANGLTFASAMHVLANTAIGTAAVFIGDCRSEGMTFPQVVHELEVRYGSLMTTREALKKLNTAVRPEGMSIDRFVNDLKRLARLVVRQETDEAVKLARYNELVKGALLRTANRWARRAIELKENSIYTAHSREMTITEMEVEIRRAESEALEYRTQENRNKDRGQYKNYRGRAQAVSAACASESENEGEAGAIQAVAEFESTSDPILDFMVQQIIDKKKEDRRKGRQPGSREKLIASAARRFNRKYTNRDPAKVAEVEYRQQRGPPNRLTEHGKTIQDLLALANVAQGECILCGMKGHIKSHHSCPLKGRRITDRPCIQCGRGLHEATDCILSHLDPRQHINAAGDDDDDDSLNED